MHESWGRGVGEDAKDDFSAHSWGLRRRRRGGMVERLEGEEKLEGEELAVPQEEAR